MNKTNPNQKTGSKLLIIFVVAAMISTALIVSFDVIKISGDSMAPTLKDGESVLVWSLPYTPGMPGGELEYGDIIVVKAPESLDSILVIKRVIGLANDEITIRDGIVFRNGDPLMEDYILGSTLPFQLKEDAAEMPAWDIEYSYVVPENHVYLLGDNRLISSDSRDFGALPLNNLIGRMIFH